MENTNDITKEQIKAEKKIKRYIDLAVKSWTNYNNQVSQYDMSSLWYGKAEKIAKEEGLKKGFIVEFDYPGLYPTFEVSKDGKHYTEYSTLSFFRRINGFWNY